jgi:hypothetical protein
MTVVATVMIRKVFHAAFGLSCGSGLAVACDPHSCLRPLNGYLWISLYEFLCICRYSEVHPAVHVYAIKFCVLRASTICVRLSVPPARTKVCATTACSVSVCGTYYALL